ncbi:MAG TPA: hypothetical protein VND93_27935, partial [Myxococcales bacterium]|nr:hypothetical protein [Myxococcales bacterium]
YWSSGTGVYRRPLDGGTTTSTVGMGVEPTYTLFLDSKAVFWNTDNEIWRANLPSGSGSAIVSGLGLELPEGVAADALHVYWVSAFDTTLRRAGRNGASPEVLVDAGTGGTGVALDCQHIYWTSPTSGTVMRLSRAGGSPEVFAPSESAPTVIALDDRYVYWADGPRLRRQPRDGGASTFATAGFGDVYDLALDDQYVYWVEFGSVVRMAK